MDIDLLLDEEDYLAAVAELEAFAENNGIQFDGTSYELVRLITQLMLKMELDKNTFVMMTKLVYNIGYRDNHFKSAIIH